MPATISPATWVADHALAGDLILTGCTGKIGDLVQRATGSPFSHTALSLGDGHVLEAYEYGLTPSENDEGVYRTPLPDLFSRSDDMRILSIRRPVALDLEAFQSAANRYLELNPAFASIGLCLIGVVRSSTKNIEAIEVARGLSSELVEAVIEAQGLLVGDGLKRVYCSELATRIYVESGMKLQFTSPVLGPLLASLRSGDGVETDAGLVIDGDVRVMATNPKRGASQPGVRRGLRDIVDTIQALRARLTENEPPDMADFIVPGDFERAMPFVEVGTIKLEDGRWNSTHYAIGSV